MQVYTFKSKATGKEIRIESKSLYRLYYNWSVSKLRDFLMCPFYFYLNRIIRLHKKSNVDIRPKPPFIFGKIIHEILYRFFSDKMVNGFKSPESLEHIFSGVWFAFSKGESFAGMTPDWPWKAIDFKSENQFWAMRQQGMEICRNFWYKNIHYFKDKDIIRPLVEKGFSDDNFGPNGEFWLYGIIDRIEFLKTNQGLRSYLIDYKSGFTNYTSAYLEKDFQFTFYQWLYSLSWKFGNEYACAPLKGMAIYPLKYIDNHEPLSISELKQVPLRNVNKLSELENIIVDTKNRLENYLNQGDFPINPGNHCQNLCPFEKQCSYYLSKYQNINPRFSKNLGASCEKRKMSDKISLPYRQPQKSKQLSLHFKKNKKKVL